MFWKAWSRNRLDSWRKICHSLHEMSSTAVIVKIPSPLVIRLTIASTQSRRSPESIARTALAEHLSYLEWRARAIGKGFALGTRDGWLSSETVMKNFARRQAAFIKKKRPNAA